MQVMKKETTEHDTDGGNGSVGQISDSPETVLLNKEVRFRMGSSSSWHGFEFDMAWVRVRVPGGKWSISVLTLTSQIKTSHIKTH
jgi:hypothetical protein